MAATGWIRRDLHLYDNPALNSALNSNDSIQPVFIMDPAFLDPDYVGDKSLTFLFEWLLGLDDDLQVRGFRLLIKQGNPAKVHKQLQSDFNYSIIITLHDHSLFAQAGDSKVGGILPLQLIGSSTIQQPGTVLRVNQVPYAMFNPFRAAGCPN